MAPNPVHGETRVLPLAGGGFLGLYTAHVLQALEARAGVPLGRCFDLIAGTSIGAVLALALSEGRLILTLISMQQQHVQAMMEDRIGERYVRLDAEWPAEAGLGIDVATADAAQRLAALAKGSMRAADAERLAPFLPARDKP